MTDPTRAVFLSYASQDAAAARRICDALRAGNIDVWFDQSELRGGDAWDQQIRKQIHDCALFIPVISATTQGREEGYFRREWKLAVERTHDRSERRAFLVPVAIDDTGDAEADVPEAFRALQWTRLPAGETPPSFVTRISQLLSPNQSPTPAPDQLSTGSAPSAHAPAPSASATRGPRLVPLLIAAFALLGVGYFALDKFVLSKHSVASRPVASAPGAIPEKSIAVLPFVDMSEKRDQEYFSDGLSEELIDLLTKIPALRVPARTSSFYFKGKPDDIATIAARLHVAHLLEGSVRKSGNRLRVTAQLIRADNGYHVWSETYDRKWDDVFKVQDEIAAAVVKALEVSLFGKPMPTSLKASNSAAYSLYLQGRAATRASDTLAGEVRAIGLLEQAAKLDPGFAPTWALLSRMRVSIYEDYKTGPLQKVRADAFRDAQQAITLDPGWAEGHVAMGRVLMNLDWNWSAAGQEMQTALELDGTNPDVLRNAHYLARALGRFAESLRNIRAAAERDPLFYYNFSSLGLGQFMTGHVAEAIASYQKAQKLFPGDGTLHGYLSLALLAQGQPAAALTELERKPNLTRHIFLFLLPRVLEALGRTQEAEHARVDAEAKYGKSDPYEIGLMYMAHKDLVRAFAWWDRAFQQHDTDLVYIKMAPAFALMPDLAVEPRFRALLRKMNLPET